MHDNSLKLCREFVERYLPRDKPLRIADVGSYDVNGTYRPLFGAALWSYVGFDVRQGPNVDVLLADPEHWNTPQEHLGAFDVVISGQTMEHVRRPWRWIRDVASLAKPGGLIWIAAPNTDVFHEHPIDCWRVWPEGMRAILEDGRLDIVSCYLAGPDTVSVSRKPVSHLS